MPNPTASPIREAVLPSLNVARNAIAALGLRPISRVTLRVRTWDGGAPGLGVATFTDTVIDPTPRARQLASAEVAASGGTYEQGDYRVDRISPQFSGGGLSTAALAPALTDAQDFVVVLTTDRGDVVCSLVKTTLDRALSYSVVVRPRRETP